MEPPSWCYRSLQGVAQVGTSKRLIILEGDLEEIGLSVLSGILLESRVKVVRKHASSLVADDFEKPLLVFLSQQSDIILENFTLQYCFR